MRLCNVDTDLGLICLHISIVIVLKGARHKWVDWLESYSIPFPNIAILCPYIYKLCKRNTGSLLLYWHNYAI